MTAVAPLGLPPKRSKPLRGKFSIAGLTSPGVSPDNAEFRLFSANGQVAGLQWLLGLSLSVQD